MNIIKTLKNNKKGFTLIEILIGIGLIAILATVVLVALNPARQFAQGRNSQRISNVNAILNAIGQRTADNKGIFETGCAAGIIPTAAAKMQKSGGYDIRPCIAPTYLAEIPFDPSIGNNTCNSDCSTGSYSTEYTVARDSTAGRITVCAPGGVEPAIPGSTAICVTR